MRLLGEINTKGTTVIVATHDMNLVRDLGRRTLLLKAGRIVEDHP
jgi:cell division transport system ATP-binding protein